MYGKEVPVTKLVNPKTKEEVTVNTSDAAQWIENGYLAAGGTVTAGKGKAAKAVTQEPDGDDG